ncbi:MAG TPA: SDR family NAD(P)-dependent oxidoreductase [Pirellulales bacterium]|jgi:short-subunit dehydrogenase|nr:SDR family NAD(P)-dependent oxidoreductase [Pirellulales bacterium]
MSYWREKVVVVTGASSGLGRVLAETWAAAGAHVVLAARGAETLEATAGEIRGNHVTQVLAVPTDVTNDDDVAGLIDRTIERFGRLDVLVNNAGRSMRRAIQDTTPSDFREQFELNTIAAVRATRFALPHLLATHGHVVNIASLAGKAPARYMGAYGPSKAALVSYTQQLRLELGPQGLHVLLVCPGPIARDEPRTYTAEELAGLPAAAAKPGAGVKTRSIEASWLAKKIVLACEHRRPELVAPALARPLLAMLQLSPRLGDVVLRWFG